MDELVSMAKSLSNDPGTSQLQLLSQLEYSSEFLETHAEIIPESLIGIQVNSFYETRKTSTVEKNTLGKWERTGTPRQMVERISAQLYLHNERRIPVDANHTDMVKFSSSMDPIYTTVVRILKHCLEKVTTIGGRQPSSLVYQSTIC